MNKYVRLQLIKSRNFAAFFIVRIFFMNTLKFVTLYSADYKCYN
jgi:hypothetical protein